jgi:heat shock protein HtpX
MNVYDEIAANDRRTIMILFAFPAALFITIFLLFLLLAKFNVLPLAELEISGTGILDEGFQFTLFVFPWVLIAAFLWIVFSYFGGGAMILDIAHAHPVTFDDDRDLYRLVENTAIMTGLPVPKIYLIDDVSMNAFATGRNPETASIALTEGLVKRLEKAELQAVIAHELAHINNRDTRLMLITIAGIGFFLFLGEILVRSTFRGSRFGRSKNSGKGALVIFAIGVACLVFGYIVAPILRFALSRRREYQADATAAKITRDPEALINALEKISDNPRVEALDASPLVGNMCIASPTELGFFSKLYLTHPPIKDRVAALRKMLVRGRAII